MKEELLKIPHSTCLKTVAEEEDFNFLSTLGVTCLRPLGTNEINYLHFPRYPPPLCDRRGQAQLALMGSVIRSGENLFWQAASYKGMKVMGSVSANW
jgi:hypothetical protein